MTNDFAALDAEILQEFPKYKLVPKADSWLMKLINVFLLACTFGRQSGFMSEFITTVGYTVYTPSSWAKTYLADRMVVLRHERVHMRQRTRYGMALFTFLYVLFPLPGGLAYFRAKFEKEAYEETMRATLDFFPGGASYLRTATYKSFIVGQFTGAAYFWMWPFKKSMDAWYDAAAEAAIIAAAKALSEPS